MPHPSAPASPSAGAPRTDAPKLGADDFDALRVLAKARRNASRCPPGLFYSVLFQKCETILQMSAPAN